MTATLDDVTKKSKREPTAEERAAEEMVARAREQGLSLTGPEGLLKQLTKQVLETALDQELTEHLGHEKNGQPVAGNVRNGTRPKKVLTEVVVVHPLCRRSAPGRRDRTGTWFRPQPSRPSPSAGCCSTCVDAERPRPGRCEVALVTPSLGREADIQKPS